MKYLYIISGLLVFVGAALALVKLAVAPYLFSVGILGWMVYKYFTQYDGDNIRYKRLQRMFFASSILQVACACLMFREENLWTLLLLVSVILDLYVSFMMKSEE
ncbi:MAG: hypothetical protein IJ270_01030 [Paludibacteraceae bacterium]|nr:hypothetical protein [Paludibacteraceae bacterium]